MKKLLPISILSIFAAFILLSIPKSAYAIKTAGTDCSWTITDENGNHPPNLQPKYGAFLSITKINLSIKVPSTNTKHEVEVACASIVTPCGGPLFKHHPKSDDLGIITDSYSFDFVRRKENIYINVSDPTYPAADNPICTLTIEPSDWEEAPTPTPAKSAECELSIEPQGNITNKTPITIKGRVKTRGLDESTLKIITKSEYGDDLTPIAVIKRNSLVFYPLSKAQPDDFSAVIGQKPNGSYTVKADLTITDKDYLFLDNSTTARAQCSLSFDVCDKGCSVTIPPTMPPTPTDDPTLCIDSNCYDKDNFCHAGCEVCWKCRPLSTPIPRIDLCDQIADPKSKDQAMIDLWEKCDQCKKKGQIWTAIGCLPISDVGTLISEKIFPVGLGIAGGIAFLYFLYGAFLILTSAGNAERVEQAKQIITSSLSGLLLIIFSVFLLKVIGVDILQLPGFK